MPFLLVSECSKSISNSLSFSFAGCDLTYGTNHSVSFTKPLAMRVHGLLARMRIPQTMLRFGEISGSSADTYTPCYGLTIQYLWSRPPFNTNELGAEIFFEPSQLRSLGNPFRTRTFFSTGSRSRVKFWQILSPRVADCDRFWVRILTTNREELALLEIEPAMALPSQ